MPNLYHKGFPGNQDEDKDDHEPIKSEPNSTQREFKFSLFTLILVAYSIGASLYIIFLLIYTVISTAQQGTYETKELDKVINHCRRTENLWKLRSSTLERPFSYPGTSSLELRFLISNGKIPIRGANLMGWLVATIWWEATRGSPLWNDVSPDEANKGEFVVMNALRNKGFNPEAQVESHRRTFYNESDFQEIAKAGLNTVRIPIGHWIAGFTNSTDRVTTDFPVPYPYVKGGIRYLDMAIREWAPRHNLVVLLNFQAAEGSQNGLEHSSPIAFNAIEWALKKDYVKRSLDVVQWLADRYKYDDSFLGISLLQEPQSIPVDILKRYYLDAYDRVRNKVHSNCLLITSPSIDEQRELEEDPGKWGSFMIDSTKVFHDWHRYEMEWDTRFREQDPKKIIDFPRRETIKEIKSWRGVPLLIGEWSLYSATQMTNEQLREYAEAQLTAFEEAKGGWVYQMWKFYEEDEKTPNRWSMRSMLKHQIFDGKWKPKPMRSKEQLG